MQRSLEVGWTSAAGTEYWVLCSYCSVFDVDDQRHREEQKNGFVFDDANEGSLSWGLDRALDYYTQRPEWWQDLVKRAMQMDLSWDASADQYLDLYEQVLSKVKV
ncbi:hypothetical protein M758_9G179300 [Ceratodon purpureus]|nr:hypothetical protein M758_9G179300 [Ceratodon purpureus]